MATEGFITIAYGKPEYIRMAKAVVMSYRLFKPTRPFTVITDADNRDELAKHFDTVVLLNPEYGNGVVQKLHLDLYTPYDTTVFIDSDCLFLKNPEIVWNCYAVGDFVMRGWRYLTGSTDYEAKEPYLFLRDVAETCRLEGISRIPHFNSGIMSWKKSAHAQKIFDDAREIYARRDRLGFTAFKNAPLADEPVFAIAMEKNDTELLPWDDVNGQETTIGMNDVFGLDLLSGETRFEKAGKTKSPGVIHFNSGGLNVDAYLRNICMLECRAAGLPLALARFKMRGYRVKQMFAHYVRRIAKRIQAA